MLGGRINEDILLNDLMCPLLITRLFSRFIERKKEIYFDKQRTTHFLYSKVEYLFLKNGLLYFLCW